MANKIEKKDGVSYICEKCGNEMFKVSVKDKNLFTADDHFKYRKYLNIVDPNGPYYTCQFCGIIHKGYYTNSGLNIDFRSLNVAAYAKFSNEVRELGKFLAEISV